MHNIFLIILNMSFTASFVIIAVMVFRLLLRKAPKIFSYVLWSVVLFRLVCPVSFPSIISLLPTHTKIIPKDIVYQQTPQVLPGNTEIAAVENTVEDVVKQALPAQVPPSSMSRTQFILLCGEIIWVVGMVLLFAYSLLSIFRLRKRLYHADKIENNIFRTENIRTPFVFGMLKPKIYMPAHLSEEERGYILKHEQTHIRRKDPIIKLIAFLVLCLHWFNPLVWAAFVLMTKDMEMSCDEAVVQELGNGIKKEYSRSLLALATSYRIIGGTPLAFGEGEVKGRVKNVLHYKKPAFWGILLAMAAVIVIIIALISNPSGHVSVTLLNNAKELSKEQVQWYESCQNAKGVSICQLDNQQYFVYYRGEESKYANYSIAAKLRGKELVVHVKEKDASSEADSSPTVLARIQVAGAEIRKVSTFLNGEEVQGSYMYHSDSQTTVPAWLENAYAWRTEYVGNASAVGNIINTWHTLEGAKGEGFALETEEEPYGITVRYSSQKNPSELYDNFAAALEQDAVLLFSLVKNLDHVTITVNDKPIVYYEREKLEEQWGALWTKSESYEDFCKLYRQISERPIASAAPVTEEELQAMLYFKDTLYVQSEAVIDVDVSKLEAIGKVESVLRASEIPQMNGQANRKIKNAPIYDSKGSLILQIEGEYCLYEPIERKNTIIKHLSEGEARTVTTSSAEENEILEAIVFDYVIRSSGAPGIEINTLLEYYEFKWQDKVYYVFLREGKPCLQPEGQSEANHYTQISEKSYQSLENFFLSDE